MPNKIKILFLIDELNVGGTEKQLLWLSENLPRDQFSPIIGVLRETSYQTNLSINTPIINFNWAGAPFFKNIKLLCKLRNYFRNEKFDIIQTYFIESEIYGSLAAHSLNKKAFLVSTRRNLYHWIDDDIWRFKLSRFLSRYVDRLLVNSYAVEKKCSEIECSSNGKTTVIQNAIGIDSYNPDSSNQTREKLGFSLSDFIVGVVGNWRPVKGLINFLTAAKKIKESITSARFLLIGQGPQENELIEMSKRLRIDDSTIFLKNTVDIFSAISCMDVSVQPSLSESFSNVLLEYMALKKPIVATNVGDASYMLENGNCGILVTPGSHEKIAAGVIQLAKDREYAKQIADSAFERAHKMWSDTIIMDKYINFYLDILK